jgi:hypothetical protein
MPNENGSANIWDQLHEVEDKYFSCTKQENTTEANSMAWVTVHRPSKGKNYKYRDCHCASECKNI